MNGDYITEDDMPAWIDMSDQFDTDCTIIDFGGDRVQLRYNMDLSHTWTKGFTETKYLGGAVQGDWTPAVSRSSAVSAVVLEADDDDTIAGLRRLAEYNGICHVRTPDGSSFDADVQVTESRTANSGMKSADFALKITRVDPEGLDGMTLEQWEEGS